MDKNQASVDPGSIDEATRVLERFAMRIRDFENRIGHELTRLGQTFHDEMYERMYTSFQTTRKLMLTFADETSGVVPKMRDDAATIRAAQSLKI